MKNGTLPHKKDKRNYSFTRTFGSIAPIGLPDEYNCDAGLAMPDQNADGYPEGCTGYTQASLCEDEDNQVYDPSFTYNKTLFIANLPPDSPCAVQDSLKSLVVYGVGKKGETDAQAEVRRRGQYYQVQPATGLDWFDSIRSTLYVNRITKRSISVGTPWFFQWHFVPKGILADFSYAGIEPWHNWKISGWKSIQGVPYLIAKTWQGPQFGDQGWCYISRETFNRCMAIPGTVAFTVAQWDGTPLTIQYGILYRLQILINLILRKYGFSS
jgi:hypothetical protein